MPLPSPPPTHTAAPRKHRFSLANSVSHLRRVILGCEPYASQFIDGFQGCVPSGPGLPGAGGNCGRTVGTCTTAQAKAWTDGLGTALWELHRQLKALGNKTIICNGTGQMYACGGATPCFCDAANKERFCT